MYNNLYFSCNNSYATFGAASASQPCLNPRRQQSHSCPAAQTPFLGLLYRSDPSFLRLFRRSDPVSRTFLRVMSSDLRVNILNILTWMLNVACSGRMGRGMQLED